MERLFFECTVRVALLVAITALVLYTMRVKSAAIKHRVWSAVVLLMLLLPIWTAWGPKASLYVLPTSAHGIANGTLSPVISLSIAFLSSSLVQTVTAQAVLLGIYLLGFCLLLSRLAVGTFRARGIVRDSVVQKGLRTSHVCVAPMTIGFLHPVVILPNHWRRWPQARLHTVLTHEYEHARRRDPLVQWLALLNRAFFWFHPAAWWLERHLSGLAEEACDDAVLARGHNPREYAECLIEMARSVLNARSQLNITGMAMPGSFLPQRIRKIIEYAPVPRISRMRIASVTVMCTMTCSVIVAGTLGRVQLATPTQSNETQRAVEILTPHEGVDFTPYTTDLLQTVRRNWLARMPQEVEESGAKGKVSVRFTIRKNGKLEREPLAEVSSGIKSLDDAAVSAIRASAPFEHLPGSFKGPKVEIRLTFLYNLPLSALNP